MFFSNFDDSTKSRTLSVILYIVAGLLIAVSVLSFFFLFGLFLRGERSWIILLLPLLPIISLLYVSKYLLWIPQKVTFTDDGLLVHSCRKQTLYPWNTIEEYGVFSISLFTTSNITPYFFFILSSAHRVKKYCTDLSLCFFMRRDVIVVRYTEKRNQQVEGILKKNTKIYDWNDDIWEHEWNPNREEQSPPKSPWPKWQRYEEQKRNKKRSSSSKTQT